MPRSKIELRESKKAYAVTGISRTEAGPLSSKLVTMQLSDYTSAHGGFGLQNKNIHMRTTINTAEILRYTEQNLAAEPFTIAIEKITSQEQIV